MGVADGENYRLAVCRSVLLAIGRKQGRRLQSELGQHGDGREKKDEIAECSTELTRSFHSLSKPLFATERLAG
jgi:hypothetical protein